MTGDFARSTLDQIAVVMAALEGEYVHADEERRDQIKGQLKRLRAARHMLTGDRAPALYP